MRASVRVKRIVCVRHTLSGTTHSVIVISSVCVIMIVSVMGCVVVIMIVRATTIAGVILIVNVSPSIPVESIVVVT